MRVKLIFILFLGLAQLGFQPSTYEVQKVWVFFTDKDSSNFNPYTFFDPLAIERRNLEGISLYEASDFPVKDQYIRQVEAISGNNRAVSRWFNAMCCLANESQIEMLRELPFVSAVKAVNRPENLKVTAEFQRSNDEVNYDPTPDQIDFINAQVARMQGDVFKKYNMNGAGVRIAVFDIGFKSYKSNPVFEHIRKENRIIKTYDFVKNKENVDLGGSHGCVVMSCIGGKVNGVAMGLATGSEFLLARTETWTEPFSEEENWLAAVEWADQNGAHIINSSLGYTFHRYFTEDMDGEKSLVAKAANLAAKKGLIVVNSAGNEGDGDWKIIGTPADADSVLAIGGINPESGIHTSFSSFGPTRDKRLKPNVSAYGHVIGSGPDGLSETQGTSFSSPLVAGFVACAKQSRPAFGNMQLFKEIEKSGDLYPYFDYAHGYGIPQASYFMERPKYRAPTFELITKNGKIYIQLKYEPRDTNDLRAPELNAIADRMISVPPHVFYHIENKVGYLQNYYVVDPQFEEGGRTAEMTNPDSGSVVSGEGPLVIPISLYPKPFTLRVFYKGYTNELKVK